jgi:DNA-binding transcriptional ArsR family regulator
LRLRLASLRARFLYCLLDGHARTSSELAVVVEVSRSTASDHLSRLKDEGLVSVLAQGKHRYYSLDGCKVAAALEALTVLVGRPDRKFDCALTPVDRNVLHSEIKAKSSGELFIYVNDARPKRRRTSDGIWPRHSLDVSGR